VEPACYDTERRGRRLPGTRSEGTDPGQGIENDYGGTGFVRRGGGGEVAGFHAQDRETVPTRGRMTLAAQTGRRDWVSGNGFKRKKRPIEWGGEKDTQRRSVEVTASGKRLRRKEEGRCAAKFEVLGAKFLKSRLRSQGFLARGGVGRQFWQTPRAGRDYTRKGRRNHVCRNWGQGPRKTPGFKHGRRAASK